MREIRDCDAVYGVTKLRGLGYSLTRRSDLNLKVRVYRRVIVVMRGSLP
jgi:hypothetical protein